MKGDTLIGTVPNFQQLGTSLFPVQSFFESRQIVTPANSTV